MKKAILFILLVLSASGLFAEEELKGQIIPINEKANEEVIITNLSPRREAFKIYIHTTDGSAFHLNAFSASYTSAQEGWQFLFKTPELNSNEKWKSPNDYELLELADYICIESKTGIKYTYQIETKHDKLYITVKPFKKGDDW